MLKWWIPNLDMQELMAKKQNWTAIVCDLGYISLGLLKDLNTEEVEAGICDNLGYSFATPA